MKKPSKGLFGNNKKYNYIVIRWLCSDVGLVSFWEGAVGAPNV